MTKIKYISVLLVVMLLVACNKNDVSFTYSPTEPRAGQTVSFTNNTEEGEKWEWNFGDGTSSTSKNPAKVYKRAGEYTVVLKVDEKAHRSYSMKIMVYDTVPCITISDTIAYVYQPVTLTAAVYNPYGASITYNWHFSDDIIVLDGDSSTKQVEVCFTKHSAKTRVSCDVMYGEQPITLDTAFYVTDTVAPSLLMTTKDGRLLRQRLFDYGADEVEDYQVSASLLTAPRSLAAAGDSVYVFNADQTADGCICLFDLAAQSARKFVGNSSAGEDMGFYNGVLYDGTLFWTDSLGGFVYYLQPTLLEYEFVAGASSPYYLTNVTQLPDYSLSAGSAVSGLALYNNTFYLGYGKGVYRFSGIKGAWTSVGAILEEVAVERFVIDAVGRKVYYVTGGALYVSGLAGQTPVQISDKVCGTALCVDNAANRVYWAEADGVYYLPLVQTANNMSTDEPVRLNVQTGVVAMTMDVWPRYAK